MKKHVTLGILALSIGLAAPTGHMQKLIFMPALADDDDGGGDDDNGGSASVGGNAGGSGSLGSVWKQKKIKKNKRKRAAKTPRKKAPPRRVVKTASGPDLAAPNELVIRKLSPQNLDLLLRNGYNKIAEFTDRDGTVTARFRIPSRTSLLRARNRARALLPGLPVDLNHYFRQGYKVQSDYSCKGAKCAPFDMVGWKASLVSCSSIPEIGIIDTWVDAEHQALANAKISRVQVDGMASDGKGSGHGTAIAALLVGNTSGPVPGLLPQANIAVANVFETSASGDERTNAFLLSSALQAFERRGTKIVNMSLAGPPNDVLAETIETYSAKGMIILAASGNAGPSAKPAYPAAYEDVIAVTAVSEKLKIYRRAGRGKHIDISAPGVQIKTAGRKNGVEVFTGSSFAVPFVTAAVAAHMAGQTAAVTSNINDILKNRAIDLGTPGEDPIYGAGLLQITDECAK